MEKGKFLIPSDTKTSFYIHKYTGKEKVLCQEKKNIYSYIAG